MTDKPIMVAVSLIRENLWNPNEVPPDVMAALKRNIERFGFNQPILVRLVDADLYEVVDGAHRFRAAVELGIDKIPVVVREFTDAEAKAQTIAMNRLRGEMDPALMARLVREIEAGGIPAAEFGEFSGFTAKELDDLDNLLHAVGDDPPADPTPAPDQSGQVSDSYVVMVTCTDERAQLALLERLEGEGFECRCIVA